VQFKDAFVEMLRSLVSEHGDDLDLEGFGDTYYLTHRQQRTLQFRLHWVYDHFLVHIRDDADNESHAIVAIYTPYDAALFCTAVSSLFEIRARRRGASETVGPSRGGERLP
jgi:hypothetical protein